MQAVKIIVGLVALAIATGCGRAAPAAGGSGGSGADCAASAQTFWQSFREAAASGDAARLSAMSRFPLAVEGTLDEPQPPLGKREFEAMLPALLAADTGLREEGYPQRQLVADTARAAEVDCSGASGEFRVGTMVFDRSGGEWHLAKIYVE